MTRSALPILLILLGIAVSSPVGAQVVDDDFEEDFPEEPLTYVALGAGFTPTFVFMDLDELNELARSFNVDEFSGPLSVYGGNIMFTPVFIPNIRVGFYAVGGYHRSSRPIRLRDTVYQRTLRFGIRFQAGLQFDYAFRMADRLTLLPSVVIGWGSYALELTQSHPGGTSFAIAFNPERFGTDTTAAMSNLDRGVRLLNYHAFLYPALHLEYAFTGRLMLRGSVGYHLGALDNEWRDEGDSQYTTDSNIDADGPAVQVGIFFGVFTQ